MRSTALGLCIPVLLFATTILPLHAQPIVQPSGPLAALEGELTLNRALQMATQKSAVIAGASNELNAVKGAAVQAGLRPNPVLSTELEDTPKGTRKTTVLLGIPLEIHGERESRVLAAQTAVDAADADLGSTRSDVVATVMQAFFELVIAQERLALAQGSAQVAQRATEATAKHVSAGRISPVDETRARVAQATSELEVNEAASELESLRYALAATWGSSTPGFSTVRANVSELPRDIPSDVLEKRIARAPLLVAARAELARRKALRDVEGRRRYANPTLSIGAKRDQELARTELVVGLSIPLPLFDRNQGNLQEASSRVDKAQSAFEATEVRVNAELRRAAAKLKAARTSAQTFTLEILRGAENAYRSTTRGFEAGKFSFLDVLDAQRTFFQARSQYLTVVASAYTARATIDRLLGAEY